MKNEIGIGIIDLFSQKELNECIESVSRLNFDKDNLLIMSLTENKIPKDISFKRYTTFVQLSFLRNYILSQFRLKKLKYFFILNSNQIVKNENLLEDTINLGNTFGTWFILGHDNKIQTIEDDSKIELSISNVINPNFLFLNYAIVKNFGFFNEKYCNGDKLDILDYIINLRTKKVFPPSGYYPTIDKNWIEKTNSKITVKGYTDLSINLDKSLNISYGHFVASHKYMPLQDDQKPVTVDDFLSSMEFLQKNYSKNENSNNNTQ
jgi:predicted phosphohydrolase